MNGQLQLISRSPEETSKIGGVLATQLRSGAVVALFGDLGSGKTLFCQAIGRALGVQTSLRSPTFILESRYVLRQGSSTTLYHLDLYRMKKIHRHDAENIRESLADRNGIVLIEWADRLARRLSKKSIRIYFETLAPEQRRISISGLSTRASKLLMPLTSAGAHGPLKHARASSRRPRPSVQE